MLVYFNLRIVAIPNLVFLLGHSTVLHTSQWLDGGEISCLICPALDMEQQNHLPGWHRTPCVWSGSNSVPSPVCCIRRQNALPPKLRSTQNGWLRVEIQIQPMGHRVMIPTLVLSWNSDRGRLKVCWSSGLIFLQHIHCYYAHFQDTSHKSTSLSSSDIPACFV